MPRSRLLMALALAAGGWAAGLSAQVPAAPPPPPLPARDPVPPSRGRGPGEPFVRTVPVGTASIAGVVTAAETGRPLRGVRVTISGTAPSEARGGAGGLGPVLPSGSMAFFPGAGPGSSPTMGVSRTVMTDGQGQFLVQRLPAGRFMVNASRNGYLNATYGQKRPGGRGAPVALADGQQARVALQMVKGGVVTGTVIGDDGEPQPNAQVRVWRYATETGVRRLQGANSATTDDRGMYRIHGLQPGEYIVSATPNSFDLGSERMAAEMAAVEQAIATSTPRPSTAPGVPATVSVTVAPPQPEAQAPLSYLPTYHPSTLIPAESPVIRINGGDERAGVDVQVQLVRASSIHGTVSAALPPGVGVQLSLMNDDPAMPASQMSTRARPDGGFTFGGVSPGRYTILAFTVAAPMQPTVVNGAAVMPAMPVNGPPRLEDSQKFWGRASVNVEGQPIAGVTLTLQPGRTIAGQVLFDMPTPPDLTQGRPMVTLNPAPGWPVFGPSPQAPIGPDGRFAIAGVVPGRYILRVNGTGGALKSSIVHGQDTLDSPLEFTGERDIYDALITLTDKTTELSGTLTDSAGQPAFDYIVLAASADQRFWTPGSRRIVLTQIGLDGAYVFRNLPPGDYLIAAVSDLEPGGQYDPELLRSLAGASMRVTIAEGQKVSQNLRVAR